MGRYGGSGKNTVEDCKSISIFWLKKQGCFKNGIVYTGGKMKWTSSMGEDRGSIGFSIKINGDKGQLTFQYTYANPYNDIKEELDYPVDLVSTLCNYGGRRWWFICTAYKNGIYCGRRVGKLYLGSGGKYFACRHCYNLTYQSCKEHDKRISGLLRNPELFMAYLNGKDSSKSLLAIKAGLKYL